MLWKVTFFMTTCEAVRAGLSSRRLQNHVIERCRAGIQGGIHVQWQFVLPLDAALNGSSLVTIPMRR